MNETVNFDLNAAIPGPSELGVSKDGKLSQIMINSGALSGYVDILLSGKANSFTKRMLNSRGRESKIKPIGARFFSDSIRKGKWTNPITNETKMVAISEFVDMVPRGVALGETVGKKLNDSGMELRGIVPGVIEDITQIDPSSIFKAANSTNNAKCILVQAPVNKRLSDGSLSSDAEHNDIPYLSSGEPDWGKINRICNRGKLGKDIICESRYIESEQEQPKPIPPLPVYPENENVDMGSLEGFRNEKIHTPNINYKILGVSLFMIVVLLIIFKYC
jgi:hypothetical protein